MQLTLFLFLSLLSSYQTVAKALLLLVEAGSTVGCDVGEGRSSSRALCRSASTEGLRADGSGTWRGEDAAHTGTNTACEHDGFVRAEVGR